MTSRILAAALSLLLLAGAAVGVARSAADRSPDPAVAPAADHPGTLIATVEIDHLGVRVVQATRKPDLRFRAPRHEGGMPFAWTMRGTDGRALAASGFDPFRICLDPTHAGQPPHIEGDVRIPHVAHFNVKLPDLPDAATIEFVRRDAGATPTPFGSVRRDAMPIR